MSTSDGTTSPVFARPAAGVAQHSQAVRLIDVEQEPVLATQRRQRGQIGEVAVHAVDALHGDEHPPVPAGVLAQEAGQIVEIVVGERAAVRAGQPDALQDAVMRQSVVQREVARAQQVSEHADVRRVPAHHGQGRRCAEMPGDLVLEFLVQRAAARRRPGWPKPTCRTGRSPRSRRRPPPGAWPARGSRSRRSRPVRPRL